MDDEDGYFGEGVAARYDESHSNYDLAKIVVYTEGKTPEETRDSILAAIAEKA